MEKNKSTVVIVGGGVAGATAAKILQFYADLVLIDPKEYFEIPWAEMRAKVEPSFANRSIVNHREYLINGRLVVSSAVEVRNREVLTEKGQLIPYDYLVIATGHSEALPPTKQERLRQFEEDFQKIRSSRSVLIVGGGPSGVELAGEIAVDFPDKKITLVHNGSRLMDFIGAKASRKALDWLVSKRVEVLLDQSVDLLASEEEEEGQQRQHVFTTSSGEKISADCCFTCTGKPSGSDWLKDSFLRDCLDRYGRLMVDEHLRVRGFRNIFAIGDITDFPEVKQGYLAQKHAKLVAKNLKVLLQLGREKQEDEEEEERKATSKLSSYKPSESGMAIVSLGRKEAVAQFPFTTMSGRLPGMLKSKDLFVGKTRKEMGLDPVGDLHTFKRLSGK